MVGPDIVQTFSDTPFFWSRKDLGKPQQQNDVVQVSLAAQLQGCGLAGRSRESSADLRSLAASFSASCCLPSLTRSRVFHITFQSRLASITMGCASAFCPSILVRMGPLTSLLPVPPRPLRSDTP